MKPEVIQNRRELVKGWLSRTLLNAGSTGITVNQIADAMGLSESSLYKKANIGEESQNLHLNDLIPLLDETGDFFILEELARLFGFALVPLGDPVEMLKVLVKAMEEAKT
jgi:hypothetical protein